MIKKNEVEEIYMSELKKHNISSEKERELLKNIKKGDKEAEKEFVEGNLRLVLSIASKYSHDSLDLMDLVQEGNIGLLKAIEKFDLSRENKFSTYAVPWIKQAISRSINNDGDTIRKPVHYTETLKKINRVENYIIKKKGYVPSKEELAKALKISKKQLDDIYALNYNMLSLESNAFNNPSKEEADSVTLLETIEAEDQNVEDKIMSKIVKTEVNEAMNDILTPREKEVLMLRFGFNSEESKTLQEIGDKFNLSRERIRQIESKAINKLRRAKSLKNLADFIPDTKPKTIQKKKIK